MSTEQILTDFIKWAILEKQMVIAYPSPETKMAPYVFISNGELVHSSLALETLVKLYLSK